MRHIALIVFLCAALYGELCNITLEKESGRLVVSFVLEKDAYLITESISVEGEGLSPIQVAIPSVPSEDYGAVTKVPFKLIYSIAPAARKIKVNYQGCEADMCHLPESREYDLETLRTVAAGDEAKPVNDYIQWTSASGFMEPEEFIQWAEGRGLQTDNVLRRAFDRFGLLIVLLLLLPLGFLLNLTPCVLPMIPINLALIGAGQNVPRRERLLRGFLYGAGMSLAYGTLGIVTVLTGARFGALSASPWINGLMTLVFIALGLSMLGLFDIDLSRFRGFGKIGGLAGVFIAGVFSAILSGACVAPVLIWALLLSTTLYSEGNVLALLIPYMLGVGMALPWPLVAAGLARLPKPGAWMVKVRRAFGVLILLFACYCGLLTWRSLHSAEFQGGAADYDAAFAQAKTSGRKLLLIFRGRVCRACDKMEQTTFQNQQVKKKLENWVCLVVDADDRSNAPILEKYGIRGVPSFVLIDPTRP